MTSISYQRWRTERAKALDELADAHLAVGGAARGRRFATQQINHAYAMLLASQFQGFCRDLHAECVDHIITVLAAPAAMSLFAYTEFKRGRQLDQENTQPSSTGADFGRFGLDFWPAVIALDSKNQNRKLALEMLNSWRNAIAH